MSKFTYPVFSRAPNGGQMIYFCSFKGTHKGLPGVVNMGIRALDKADYSHTEIAVGHPFKSAVQCISSVGTDGGVRPKSMQLDPADWDILPMPWVTSGVCDVFLQDHKGAGYDYMGTGRFALPFLMREHPKRWFCTEVGMAIAGFDDPWRFTPQSGHVAILAHLKIHYPGIDALS